MNKKTYILKIETLFDMKLDYLNDDYIRGQVDLFNQHGCSYYTILLEIKEYVEMKINH